MNEEEDVSSYWIKFSTKHYDGNLNKKQQIDLFGELALEWTMDGTDVNHLGEKNRGKMRMTKKTLAATG